MTALFARGAYDCELTDRETKVEKKDRHDPFYVIFTHKIGKHYI